MNNFFIIFTTRNRTRFKKKQKKQYTIYKNLKLYEHSIIKAIKSKLFKKIVLVIDNPKNVKNLYSKDLIIIKGGKRRSESSIIALKHITKPANSIKYDLKNNLYNLDREKTYLTQTPQGFNFNNLYQLSLNEKINITDEASLFINNDKKIKLINGEKKNKKITFGEDLQTSKTYFGLGFDIHRLVKGKILYLGGIKIPFHSGLKGHSDGDVILHSIIDALLGALRQKDIGTYFPSNTKKFRNIRSPKLLMPINDKLTRLNFDINNIDINLICYNVRTW